MSARPWAEIIAEAGPQRNFHQNVLDEYYDPDHTDYCEITQCTGLVHEYRGPWRKLIEWAERITEEKGFPLQSFWVAVEEGDYDKALKLMQSTNTYSKRQAKYYEAIPRSHFGQWADGTIRNDK